MTERVACQRCGAHRDLILAPRCLVCGAERYTPVTPPPVVMDAIDREVIAAAEALDESLDRTHLKIVPGAQRLREACRQRTLALAGRMTA